MRVTFTIPGKPVGKQRPRFGNGRAFTPKETVSFERTVGQIAALHFPAPITGPVSVEIIAIFATPDSWSAKKRAATIHRPHTQRPDLDNCQKAVLDGLNRIAFADDGQVAQITARKVWGVTAQTVVHVEPMGAVE